MFISAKMIQKLQEQKILSKKSAKEVANQSIQWVITKSELSRKQMQQTIKDLKNV